MKYMTAAITRPPVSRTRQKMAAAILRLCGEMLKGINAAWCDPMTSNAYWIGANPDMWDVRK